MNKSELRKDLEKLLNHVFVERSVWYDKIENVFKKHSEKSNKILSTTPQEPPEKFLENRIASVSHKSVQQTEALEYQPLFDLMSKEHNLTLFTHEMDDIIRASQKVISNINIVVTDEQIKAIELHEKHYGEKADEQGYRHYEMNVYVSTKEEDFSKDKMFLLICSAIRGENPDRYLMCGQPKESAQHKESTSDAIELKPKVVCLCGSTRFAEHFMIKRWELEKQGIITLGINILPDNYFAEGNAYGAEQEGVKHILDELHKRKIDLSDEVFVLNVGGYIGKSTRNEIEYAVKTNKPVKYLETKTFKSQQ